MAVVKTFFDIEQYETKVKKFIHFWTDVISVSVLWWRMSTKTKSL
jgi:hypothetical protein